MDSIRADTLVAFEAAFNSVPIVAAVYDYPANVPPPSGKVTIEYGLATEGPNTRKNGGRPNNGVFNHPLRLSAKITGGVPKHMDAKQFERDVVAPIQVAVATSEAIAAIDPEAFLEGIEWDPYQDGRVESLSAIMVWNLTYSAEQTAPGTAL